MIRFSPMVAGIALIAASGSASAQSAGALPSQRPVVDAAIEFPHPVHAIPPEGVFIEPRNLALITNGMTKLQVRTLLGVPHFGEGLFGVRRWNYLFNFYTGNGNDFVTCQFQVRFDNDVRVSGSWIRYEECGAWLNHLLGTPPQPAAAAEQ